MSGLPQYITGWRETLFVQGLKLGTARPPIPLAVASAIFSTKPWRTEQGPTAAQPAIFFAMIDAVLSLHDLGCSLFLADISPKSCATGLAFDEIGFESHSDEIIM